MTAEVRDMPQTPGAGESQYAVEMRHIRKEWPGVLANEDVSLSVLKGEISMIAEHAARLTSTEGIYGVDLLAYRHESEDPVALTRAVAVDFLELVLIDREVAAARRQVCRRGSPSIRRGGVSPASRRFSTALISCK